MQHRHLTHEGYTSAAIDDIIGRGSRNDWAALRAVAVNDPVILKKILRVCEAHVNDPYEQRFYLWKYYAEHHLA